MVPFIPSTEESALVGGGFLRRQREQQRKNEMKTLKFMLAAATAIGLASASQAVGPTLGSTSFEDYSGTITDQTDSQLFVLPTGWEDGDYSIVTEGLPSASDRSAGAKSKWSTNSKALKLEGGISPLEIKVSKNDVGENITAGGELYVDTLVQFTVTPAGDSVTASSSDKLMIFLKEDLTAGAESTNLVVKAGCFDSEGAPVSGGKDYVVVLPEGIDVIEPGTWYRLTVKVLADVGSVTGETWTGFQVYINDLLCTNDGDWGEGNPLEQEAPESYFLSLKADGSATANLKTVGFAGSGMVDDVLVTTFDPQATLIDFTLALVDADGGFASGTAVQFTTEAGGTMELTTAGATGYCYGGQGATDKVTMSYTLKNGFKAEWTGVTPTGEAGSEYFTPVAGTTYTLTVTPEITTVDFTFALGTGVSAIKWVVGDVTNTVSTATATASADADATITIAEVTYGDWYVADTTSLYAGSTVTATAGATYSVNAKAVGNASGEIDVPAGTTAADLGISNAAFADDTPAQLTKLAAWAKAKNVAMSTINDTTAMSFNPETQAAKAFLLNCANTAADVEAAEAAFKFNAIAPGTVPAIEGAANYNGTVTVKGGATLDAINVTPATSEHKFYKAVLTK